MKTAEEIVALTSLFNNPKYRPTFDGSPRDEILQGYIQAHQDLAFENKRFDEFALEQMTQWNEWYATGYSTGRLAANKIFSSLQTKKRGFTDPSKFNAKQHYGRFNP